MSPFGVNLVQSGENSVCAVRCFQLQLKLISCSMFCPGFCRSSLQWGRCCQRTGQKDGWWHRNFASSKYLI